MSKEEREEIERKVFKVIQEQLNVTADEIASDKSFNDDLGADSLDLVELVMAFEEAFDIEIPDEDAEKIKTVGGAIEQITEKLKERPLKS